MLAPGELKETEGTRCFLVSSSAAHFFLNFAIIGQAAIPGSVFPSLVAQAGAGPHVEVIMLLAGAAGDIAANTLTGWWTDRYPANYLFAASCFVSMVALAVLPHVSGLLSISICYALIMQGSGVGDCSFAALVWVVKACGSTKIGMYTGVKNLGNCVGSLLVPLLALATYTDEYVGASSGKNYQILAYSWSGVCALTGLAMAILPSPSIPNKQASGTDAAPAKGELASKWRESAVVWMCGAIAAMIVGVFMITMTLPSKYFGERTGQKLIITLQVFNVVGQFLMSPAMKVLLPATAHAILISASVIGCALIGISFLGNGTGMVLVFIGYGVIGATLLTNFSVLFAFVESFVELSGSRSSIIGLGAAMNPLLCAVAAAVPSATAVFFGCSALLAMSGAFVAILHLFGEKFLQRPSAKSNMPSQVGQEEMKV